MNIFCYGLKKKKERLFREALQFQAGEIIAI
jgi:hypothetical protein